MTGQQAQDMLQKTVRKKILPTPEQSDELKSSLLLAKFWMLSIWKTGYLRQITEVRTQKICS